MVVGLRTVEGDPFPELRLRDGSEVVVGDVKPDAGARRAEPPDVAEVAVEEAVRGSAHALRPEAPSQRARPPHEAHQRVERPRGQRGGEHRGQQPPVLHITAARDTTTTTALADAPR